MRVDGANSNIYERNNIENLNNVKENITGNVENNRSNDSNLGVVYESTRGLNESTNISSADLLRNTAELQSQNIMYLIDQTVNRQAEHSISRSNNGTAATGNVTQQQAAELVSEDGFWGVKQTSERLFSIAVAAAGGDEEKMEEMKNAIIKGFENAEKQWGGELPDISQQTFDAIMVKFDNWSPS